MAFTTIDDVVAALGAGKKIDLHKASATAEGAGTWHSLWKVAGQPVAGATPSGGLAGSIPTLATAGAISRWTNPTGGAETRLLHAVISGSTQGKVILYDRLWANSGMSGAQTTTNTTLGATPDLTRPDALGDGVELWGEIYTAIGATGATLNVQYTNQAGTTGQVATYAHPANAESVGQMFPLVLAAGDTGVRKATAYHWSVSTGTAGDFGLVLLRRVAEIPIQLLNIGYVLDFAGLGMPQILDDACLSMMVLCTTTNTGLLQGSIVIGQN